VQPLSPAVAAVFDPVQAPSTFEETVERLGTAIRLGLLPAGSRLPPERELSEQLGISRSTLRQAMTSTRGRTGGTFVADAPPLAASLRVELAGAWRELLDYRIAVEIGTAVLAVERATDDGIARLESHIEVMAGAEEFSVYRRADVAFHLGLAELARAPRLVAAMTEVQGAMTELIAHIPHPPHVLERSNHQHERLVECLRRRDVARVVRLVREHLEGTEHIVAGLLP
jgi:GntR family transcriptional repressor for pyruvate dehydrogenase complex